MTSPITPKIILSTGMALFGAACVEDPPTIALDQIAEVDTSPSSFITQLEIDVDPALVEAIRFSIRPRPGAQAEPLSARYVVDALSRGDGGLIVPVFGLYSDYANTVDLTFELAGGDDLTLATTVAAGAYEDPTGPYDQIEVTSPIDPQRRPDYSYLLLENQTNQGPIVVDIDGFVRWVAPELGPRWPLAFDRNRFVVGERDGLRFLSLTGEETSVPLVVEGYDGVVPHREIAFGPRGFLVSVDVFEGDRFRFAPILVEVTEAGEVLEVWDFDRIVGDHLAAQGDDPAALVRPGGEWFLLNSSLYAPRDDSIIVSSRENFVMKVGYATKTIEWILGDETKHWYVGFPSLRALSLSTTGIPPVGQHSLSFVGEDLMLYNNGAPSFRLPEGLPVGRTLPSSLAQIFAIDEEAMTAEVTWAYDAGLYSELCSSIYRFGRHYLVTHSSLEDASDWRRAIIQGVDQEGALLFELSLPATERSVCRPWNTEIIDLSDVRFE